MREDRFEQVYKAARMMTRNQPNWKYLVTVMMFKNLGIEVRTGCVDAQHNESSERTVGQRQGDQ